MANQTSAPLEDPIQRLSHLSLSIPPEFKHDRLSVLQGPPKKLTRIAFLGLDVPLVQVQVQSAPPSPLLSRSFETPLNSATTTTTIIADRPPVATKGAKVTSTSNQPDQADVFLSFVPTETEKKTQPTHASQNAAKQERTPSPVGSSPSTKSHHSPASIMTGSVPSLSDDSSADEHGPKLVTPARPAKHDGVEPIVATNSSPTINRSDEGENDESSPNFIVQGQEHDGKVGSPIDKALQTSNVAGMTVAQQTPSADPSTPTLDIHEERTQYDSYLRFGGTLSFKGQHVPVLVKMLPVYQHEREPFEGGRLPSEDEVTTWVYNDHDPYWDHLRPLQGREVQKCYGLFEYHWDEVDAPLLVMLLEDLGDPVRQINGETRSLRKLDKDTRTAIGLAYTEIQFHGVIIPDIWDCSHVYKRVDHYVVADFGDTDTLMRWPDNQQHCRRFNTQLIKNHFAMRSTLGLPLKEALPRVAQLCHDNHLFQVSPSGDRMMVTFDEDVLCEVLNRGPHMRIFDGDGQPTNPIPIAELVDNAVIPSYLTNFRGADHALLRGAHRELLLSEMPMQAMLWNGTLAIIKHILRLEKPVSANLPSSLVEADFSKDPQTVPMAKSKLDDCRKWTIEVAKKRIEEGEKSQVNIWKEILKKVQKVRLSTSSGVPDSRLRGILLVEIKRVDEDVLRTFVRYVKDKQELERNYISLEVRHPVESFHHLRPRRQRGLVLGDVLVHPRGDDEPEWIPSEDPQVFLQRVQKAMKEKAKATEGRQPQATEGADFEAAEREERGGRNEATLAEDDVNNLTLTTLLFGVVIYVGTGKLNTTTLNGPTVGGCWTSSLNDIE
ncbi:hypothetical protein IAR55_005434 [Kwoniella newhampshirensis]|uniref:Uncharacterized protein n=1 Tax=Kwoniella newhampshirensis TaxID=1651941 RepID=A0AAW0YHF1_9TREE